MTTAVNPMSMQQHQNPIGVGGAQVADTLRQFLGEPIAPINPTAYDRYQYTNYDLPEAYKGRNLFLEDTVTGLILEDNEWYTTTCLPWVFSPQMHIQWNVWNFHNTLADRVPHEGISRLIKSSKSQFKGHVVRRGLAFMMEADFWATAEGQEHYRRNLTSIATAIQETQNYDTINSLLSCKDYRRIWESKFGRADVSVFSVLKEEIANYAAVSLKDENRMDVLVEQAKRLMKKQRITPNLLIGWPGMKIYLSMVGLSRPTMYWTAAEGKRLVENRGPESLGVFRDLDVFETRDFDVYGQNEPAVQLLTRSRSIGERYIMSAAAFRHANVQHFETRMRDIWIYNENEDRFERMRFIDAFKNSGIFEQEFKNGTSPYSRHLLALIKRYNDEKRFYTDSDHPFQEENGVKGSKRGSPDSEANAPPPHFLAHQVPWGKNQSQWKLVKFFGQIDRAWVTPEDWQKVAETLLLQVPEDLNGPSNIAIWQDTIRLINEIESQKYDADYWTALVLANGRGMSVAEKTPADLVEHWGQEVNQWKSNDYGGLNLPGTKGNSAYPAGFANWPGFLVLANQARGTVWADLGERAAHSVRFIKKFVSTLARLVPESEFLKVENRPAWFHKKDAETTFFSNALMVKRDPIFLLTAGGDSAPSKTEHAFESIGNPTVDHVLSDNLRDPTGAYTVLSTGLISKDLKSLNSWIISMGTSQKTSSNEADYLVLGLKESVDKSKNLKEELAIFEKATQSKADEQDKTSLRTKTLAFVERGKKSSFVPSGIKVVPKTVAKGAEAKDNVGGKIGDYHRAPLTMSPALKESLELQEAVTWILPGDPLSANTRPLVHAGLKTGGKTINKRVQNMDMTAAMLNPKEARKLSNHTFFDKYEHKAISKAIGLSGSTNKLKKATTFANKSELESSQFDDDDEGMDSDEDMADVFVSKKIGKKAPSPFDISKEEDPAKYQTEVDVAILETNTLTFERNYENAEMMGNQLLAGVARVLMFSRCDDGRHWINLMNSNVLLPINIILWRIMITHDMASVIIMKGGVETGANIFGHTNFSLGSDAATKVIQGNFTANTKALVFKEQNVHIIEDIKPERYRGGMSTAYMKNESDLLFETVEGQMGRSMRSVISTVIPIAEEKHNRIMSITGETDFGSLRFEGSNARGIYSYSTCELTVAKWRLDKYIAQGTYQAQDNFFTKSVRFNTIALQGTQFSWNSKSRIFNAVTDCQGHRGIHGSHPGVAAVWDGASQYFEKFDPSKYVLE